MEWIVEILKANGLQGVIIFVLAGALWHIWKELQTVNQLRLQERESLINALNNNTNATLEHARAIRERNDVTNKLADNVTQQATAFEKFVTKQEYLTEILRDKMSEQHLAFSAMAESNRGNSGILMSVRDGVEAINRKLP